MSGARWKRASPAASASVGFFRLPIEARNKIYQQVLVVPHPLYLFQDPGCQVETFAPETPYQWLALLYTNRQISNEARAILYGINRFTLQDAGQRQGSLLKSFLNCIGPVNTGLLSYLCIDFPATERTESQLGRIKLREDSVQSLQLLQKECTRLKTLEVLLYSQDSRDLIQTDQEINIKLVQEILSEIHLQFQDIASLTKIIVRVCNGSPASSVKEFMQGLGWIVLVGDRYVGAVGNEE
ncbi:hypothetical protein BDV28DRAFT_163201 [Aspergillus coremiiformis]|uniref:Uncharacterized protein n=1 Tax=Aspergillus coremiiformis TaxID=138285 RepID=A0A5N6YZG7_9EURO|nr:hypothetical protein BDV28DRAFT_163201 [Aspergillus coremiiformis]